MAVPKKRTSVSKKGLRRGGHTHKLKTHTATVVCSESGQLSLKGCISPAGYWKGERIFVPSIEKRADRDNAQQSEGSPDEGQD